MNTTKGSDWADVHVYLYKTSGELMNAGEYTNMSETEDSVVIHSSKKKQVNPLERLVFCINCL